MFRRRSSGQQSETIASGKAHTGGGTQTPLLRVCSERESSLKNEPNFLPQSMETNVTCSNPLDNV